MLHNRNGMTSRQLIRHRAWQRTCRQRDFDPGTLAEMLYRNERRNYGLTVVLGYPLPSSITEHVERLKRAYHEITPGRIRFSGPEAYHLTVYGLKRSRQDPYDQDKLGPILGRLRQVLYAKLSRVEILAVSLAGSLVTQEGTIIICGAENETLDQIRTAISQIDGVDPLKTRSNHITIGQFTQPIGSPEAYQKALQAMGQLRDYPVGELSVQDLKLVYYRNRLLQDVVSQEIIRLPVAD